MARTTTADAPSAWRADPFQLTLVFVLALTAVRLAVLFATPLELYPDEAQYWLWSRHLAFGYFSKPPMIAWLIRATTAIGGEAEPWVRLSAPFCHALAALFLQRAGARLYGGWVGFWAAVLYSLAPGVQLSAGVVSTDAPLLALLSAALWAYAGFVDAAEPRRRLAWAAALGLAVGLAALAKYAAFYFLAGLVLHAIWDPEVRRRWRGREIALTAGLVVLCLAPNLIWNAAHGFQTVAHTAANANLGQAEDAPPTGAPGFDPRSALGFIVAQFGVFGPIPFAVLVLGAGLLIRRRRFEPHDRLLLSLILPPLAVILAVAVLSRANANWAGAAYSPASVLVAAWLMRWRARRTLGAAVAIQGVVGVVFFAAAVSPAVADGVGFANSFKRARGWAASTEAAIAAARAAQASGPVTALVVDHRFLFNAMAYYGRDQLGRPGLPPLVMWVREARAMNQAETTDPLTPALGRRVLMAAIVSDYLREERADFRRVEDDRVLPIQLDSKRSRDLRLFIGEDFQPRPRDPKTGDPILP